MGLFDKYILKRAAKINAAKEEALKKENEYRQEQARLRSELIRSARQQIEVGLNAAINEFTKTACDISIGDRVVLNYYSFGKDGYNGWDAGPRSVLHHIEPTGPVFAKVTGVEVSTSLTSELIDRWIDNCDASSFRSTVERGIAFSDFLRKTSQNRHNTQRLGNEIGLYWDVFFELEGYDFRPRWGLNSKSFLKQGTEEFEKTFRLWTDEINAKNMIAEKTKQLREIEEEIRTLKNKFPKIN